MGREFYLDFCDKFGYPRKIKDHFAEIGCILASSENVVSIIVMGSAARGELGYRTAGDKPVLFSDYEFFVVTKKKFASDEMRMLRNKLKMFENNISHNNPLFKIDFSYTTMKKLPGLRKIVRHYELKRCGEVIYGPDLIHKMPDITLNNLDYRDLNSIVYKRLLNILSHIPEDLRFERSDEKKASTFNYVLARNALDITTVFLPYQGILLPTYRERVQYVLDNQESAPFKKHFSCELADVLRLSLKGKQGLDLDFNTRDLYRKIIKLFRELICFLRDGESFFFNEWPRERHEFLYLHKMFYLINREKGLLIAIPWLFLSKKFSLTQLLLSMHEALVSKLDGGDFSGHLVSGEREMARLDPLYSAGGADFESRWLGHRRELNSFWRRYTWGIYEE